MAFRWLVIALFLITSRANATFVKWMVVDLYEFNVKPSCLTDICQNPQFKHTLKIGDHAISSTIDLNSTPTNGVYSRIVSAPMKPINLNSYSLMSEIIGIDPTFKFERVCDSSKLEPIINYTTHENDPGHLTLQGKCFYAKMKIDIYKNTCPWCIIDQSSVISGEEGNSTFLSSSGLLIFGCVGGFVISIIFIVAFICACRLNRELANKLRRLDTSASPSTQDTESHYDMPWKNYGCRNARLVSMPYTPTKPVENLVCVSPSDHSSTIEQSPFGVCLGTTHMYTGGRDRDERYVAIRNACEDSGRDSI